MTRHYQGKRQLQARELAPTSSASNRPDLITWIDSSGKRHSISLLRSDADIEAWIAVQLANGANRFFAESLNDAWITSSGTKDECYLGGKL